jgi:hypothetical protein
LQAEFVDDKISADVARTIFELKQKQSSDLVSEEAVSERKASEDQSNDSAEAKSASSLSQLLPAIVFTSQAISQDIPQANRDNDGKHVYDQIDEEKKQVLELDQNVTSSSSSIKSYSEVTNLWQAEQRQNEAAAAPRSDLPPIVPSKM